MGELRLYIVTGLPYSGKSVLSRELVRRFDFGYASVDDEITSGGRDVTTMDQRDWNDVYARAFEKLEAMLRAGRTVVFDGASLTRAERQSLRDTAQQCGAEPVLVYVDTPPEVAEARRRQNMTTQKRAHLHDETMSKALSMFEEPTAVERPVVYNADLDLDRWVAENIRP
ncbi:ATP-binding protein [Catellatospora sp. TT07R-123]|uniref:AAA family ATPase n=1 Tax=Catellatospora sp. TT07R-123 TaxID=2733863 RepID=UPI001BB3C432|nr:ATP-binding protein [Catellatospora sp. TT07R-123]